MTNEQYREESKYMREAYGAWFTDVPVGEKGSWKIERFTIPDEFNIQVMRYFFDGRPVYAGEYTRLVHNEMGVVMSDTIAEIRDHTIVDSVVSRNIDRRVLINGLGLGVLLGKLLKNTFVKSIDVVEIDSDVIDLVGDYYKQMAADNGKTLNIYNEDAFKINWPVGTKWDVIWHDIWPTICSDNLEGMHILHRKYGHKCSWQGSWCRDWCESMRRQGR